MDVSTRIQFPTVPPIPHAPSPLGFGFGLGGGPNASFHAPAYNPHIHAHPPRPSPVHSSSMPVARSAAGSKRRYEADPDQDDETMSHSPSDRPKKALGKRIRVEQTKPNATANKTASDTQDSVDMGVLLASLPPASLLPILTSLITKHPALKPVLLSLIPRPTLDTAIQAINVAARKIKDAQPFSQPSTFATGFGFGSATPPRSFSGSPLGAGSRGQSPNGGMSDAYILNRLRPAVTEFVSTARSYLVYFTSISPQPQAPSSTSTPPSTPAELAHPSDAFALLHIIQTHIYRLQPHARSLLLQSDIGGGLLTQLPKEYAAWLNRIDGYVNRQGGIYGRDAAETWLRGMEEMVQLEERDAHEGKPGLIPAEFGAGPRPMKSFKEAWVSKVGWLAGLRPPVEGSSMEEDEEL